MINLTQTKIYVPNLKYMDAANYCTLEGNYLSATFTGKTSSLMFVFSLINIFKIAFYFTSVSLLMYMHAVEEVSVMSSTVTGEGSIDEPMHHLPLKR